MRPAKTHPASQLLKTAGVSPKNDTGFETGKDRQPPYCNLPSLVSGGATNQEAEQHASDKTRIGTMEDQDRACKARTAPGQSMDDVDTHYGASTVENRALKENLQPSNSALNNPLQDPSAGNNNSDSGKILAGREHVHTAQCSHNKTPQAAESPGKRLGSNYVYNSARNDITDAKKTKTMPLAADAKLHHQFSIMSDESKVDPLQAQKEANSLRNKSLVSFLDEAYGCFCHQVGYRTDGHQCIDLHDREEAFQTGSSLLYGELLPHGVTMCLDRAHLDAASARTLFDFGMGTGKLVLQAFLQYPSLKRVVGIEIAYSRYKLGERALLSITTRYSTQFTLVSWEKSERICIATTVGHRTLEFRRGDLLQSADAEHAEIAILQTDFQEHTHDALARLLQRLSRGARVLTYVNLRRIWDCSLHPFPFTQFGLQSRFPTSWSSKTGHLFFLWRKSLPKSCWLGQPHLALVEGKTQSEAEEAEEKNQKPRSRLWRKCKAVFTFFAKSKRKNASNQTQTVAPARSTLPTV